MQRFYLRMVFSHNFRKLYTLLLLMAILVFSFVAYQVQPNEIGAHVMALLALLLFKFSYADNLLHRLHDNRKSCAIAFAASLVFMFTPHLYTLGGDGRLALGGIHLLSVLKGHLQGTMS